MVFVKKDIIVTRLTEYEPEEIERICTKITIAKKHWLIFSVYKPPESENLVNFLNTLHQTIGIEPVMVEVSRYLSKKTSLLPGSQNMNLKKSNAFALKLP